MDTVSPKYSTIDNWMVMTGMGRRYIYNELGRGNLRAIKVGSRTLIDVDAGLKWLGSMPAAKIKAPRERQAA